MLLKSPSLSGCSCLTRKDAAIRTVVLQAEALAAEVKA